MIKNVLNAQQNLCFLHNEVYAICTIEFFCAVISEMIDYAYQRPDGVYVVPITALKP